MNRFRERACGSPAYFPCRRFVARATVSGRRSASLLTILFVSLLAASHCLGQSNGETKIEALIDGSAANQRAFKSYSLHGTMLFGEADSVEDAIAKGPTQVTARGEIAEVVDGDKIAYRRTSDAKPRPVSYSLNVQPDSDPFIQSDYTLDIHPMAYLANGKRGLNVSVDGLTASLVDDFRGVDMTTWNLCGMWQYGHDGDFAPLLKLLSQTNGITVVVKDREEYRGKTAILITNRVGKNGTDWWVDPERGYLALRSSIVFDEKVTKESVVTDVKEVAGVGWFPMRCVQVSQTKEGKYSVLELRVDSLKVGPVEAEALAIDLPADTGIQDLKLLSLIKLKTKERVSVDDIEKLQDRVAARAALQVVPAGDGR